MNPIDPRHDPPLSETDIQAYADGFLPPERAAHLRQYLGKRPGEARRVAFYGKLNQQIQDSFVPTDEPLPPPLASGKALARSAPDRWLERGIRAVMLRPLRNLLALILAVAPALLAASGWMAASQVSEEALNNAAVMALAQATDGHLSATGGSPHGVSAAATGTTAPATTASGPAAVLAAAPAPLDLAPDAPNLAPVGMHLVSYRTLKLGPLARAAEYVYLNAEEQPVVLLVARSRSVTAQNQWGAQRAGTLRLLIWNAHHQRYVLAGAADARGLMSAADLMTMRYAKAE
jgi:anti-sigma factor RsiW